MIENYGYKNKEEDIMNTNPDPNKVKELIKDDIEFLRKDIRETAQAMKEQTQDMHMLNTALTCNHEWEVVTAVYFGIKSDSLKCKICGYEFSDI